MRKPLKILLLVLLVLVLVVGGYVIYVFASYDRIEDNQVLDVNRPEQTAAGASQSAQTSPAEAAQVPIGETLSLTSWNIGFGAYTDDLSVDLTEKGGRLGFRYTLDMNGSVTGRHDVRISVRPAGA